MQADIKRHRSGDGSSVWIDPAYMRHNFISEQERSAHGDVLHSAQEVEQVGQNRQPGPLTPPPPSLPDALAPSAIPSQTAQFQHSQHSQLSPMPPRASAQTRRTTGVRPRYVTSLVEDSGDITRRPTVPQARKRQQQLPVRPYESPGYEVESSISSLSLVVSEQPTRPETPSARQDGLEHSPDARGEGRNNAFIDEINRVSSSPLVLSATHARAGEPINYAQTVPGRALVVHGQGMQVAGPSLRQPHHASQRQMHPAHAVSLNPLDRVRWWLLHPGRIEFILWLAGTVLLIAVTCIFLFTAALSLGWIAPAPLSHFASSSDGNTTPQGKRSLPTVVTYPGLKLVLLDHGPLLAGQSIHLHGEGFTAHGRVVFTYDTWQLFPNRDGMANTFKVDTHGTFTVTLVLGPGSAWSPGLHLIEVRDLATRHVAAVTCTLSQGPIGKGITPTASTFPPGSIPTPSQGTPGTGPGSIPTPVGQTPVPVTPTATPITTPTPPASPSPDPSPTQAPVTPTPPTPPTATPGVTATAGDAAVSPIPGTSTGATGTVVGVGASLITPTSSLLVLMRPLLWLVIPGYALAMLLLGLVGVLHKLRE